MCQGFGMIVSKDMRGYFCEPDTHGDVSHSTILNRLGWKDSQDQHLRAFVRVECADWTISSFRFDEPSSLPGWAENGRDEIINIASRTLSKTAPALAEYKKVRGVALAKYRKIEAAALAEYKKVGDSAWDEYGEAKDAAWDEYMKARSAARAELISKLSKVRGYVKS